MIYAKKQAPGRATPTAVPAPPVGSASASLSSAAAHQLGGAAPATGQLVADQLGVGGNPVNLAPGTSSANGAQSGLEAQASSLLGAGGVADFAANSGAVGTSTAEPLFGALSTNTDQLVPSSAEGATAAPSGGARVRKSSIDSRAESKGPRE